MKQIHYMRICLPAVQFKVCFELISVFSGYIVFFRCLSFVTTLLSCASKSNFHSLLPSAAEFVCMTSFLTVFIARQGFKVSSYMTSLTSRECFRYFFS